MFTPTFTPWGEHYCLEEWRGEERNLSTSFIAGTAKFTQIRIFGLKIYHLSTV
jgi:hypothetical protein